jgi:hypothetical protein
MRERLPWYVVVMTIYNIRRRPDGTGFDVEVVGGDGVRHTMLGFATETEANEWIVSDRVRKAPLDGPFHRPGPATNIRTVCS